MLKIELEDLNIISAGAGSGKTYTMAKTIEATKMPTIITVDLRLNEPRYASLPNIMKAKKKPLDEKTAADYGVDVTPRLTVVKTGEPEARAAGVKVADVAELVAKLKEAGAL